KGRGASEDAKTLDNQIKGVKRYMNAVQGFHVSDIGARDQPLTVAQAESAMAAYPNGTPFICLICDYEAEFGWVLGAHWIVARKNGGGIGDTHYQLDIAARGVRGGGIRGGKQKGDLQFAAPRRTPGPPPARG